MKRKSILIVGIIFFIIVLTLIFIMNNPFEITSMKLKSIIKQYGSVTSNCEIISKKDALAYITASNVNRNKLSDVSDDDKLVKINLKSREGQYGKSNEILATMDVYLYIKENEEFRNICGIICSYRSGKISDANSVDVVFSVAELEMLFDECKLNTKNINAQVLCTKWIEDNYYFRNGLETNIEYSKLISEWNRYVASEDGGYQLAYDYENNQLRVVKNEKNKYGDVGIVTSKTVWKNKLDEDGAVYATWDKENNIWLLGESLGLKLFQFNEIDSWLMVDEYSDFTIPNILNDVTFRE